MAPIQEGAEGWLQYQLHQQGLYFEQEMQRQAVSV